MRVTGDEHGIHDQNAVPSEALLALYAGGDKQAARILMQRLLPRVLSHAQRLLGNRSEAEDVAQEAMLRLWQIAPDWRQGEARVTTWLYRVTANLCKDRQRKARGISIDEVAEPEDDRAGPAEDMQDAARAAELQQAILQLPDRQRQAIVLRHLEELGNPEIAAIMELSVEAVESLLARGKRGLSAALSARREELGYGA